MKRSLDIIGEARWVTRERVLRWGVGFAVLSAIVMTGAVALNLTSEAALKYMSTDFANYWAAARLAVTGHRGDVYDLAAFDAFEKRVFGETFADNIYGYPPIHLLLTLPFAAFPFVSAFVLWTLLGLGACAAGLSRLVGWPAAALAVAAAPPSLLSMMGGNSGEFAAALIGGGLILIDRRPVLAGVLLGLVTVKPQLGVLLPFALAAGGKWRTFAAAAAAVGVLAAASLIALGPDAWTGFLRQMSLLQRTMAVPSAFWARSQTVFLSVNYLGVGVKAAYAAQAAVTALMVVATVVVWRGPASLAVKSAVLVVATFLATTYARDYDTVVLLFAAAWLVIDGRRTGFLPWERLTVLLLLTEPLLADALTVLTGVMFGPVLLAIAFLVLLRRALLAPAGDLRLVGAQRVSAS